MQSKYLSSLFLSFVLLCTTACSGLLESPVAPDRTFILVPAEAPAENTRQEGVFKLKLRVVPGLDTDRLVTIAGNSELSHFAAARWPDNLPEFAGSLIERSLKTHGWLVSGQAKPAAAREGCELNLEIERFHTLLGSAGQPSSVEIQWDGFYRCEAFSIPVQASGSAQVGQKDMSGVVRAYQQGFDLAMQSTIRQMKAHEPH